MKTLNITAASILVLASIAAYEYIEPPPKENYSLPTPNTSQIPNLSPGRSNLLAPLPPKPTPIARDPNPEDLRIIKMSKLLGSIEPNSYQEYKQLCAQAKENPKIGMTFTQSRATSWCFPYSRNKTTNINGEYVQEVYLKNPNGPTSGDKKYLYFENGILTSIQE